MINRMNHGARRIAIHSTIHTELDGHPLAHILPAHRLARQPNTTGRNPNTDIRVPQKKMFDYYEKYANENTHTHTQAGDK